MYVLRFECTEILCSQGNGIYVKSYFNKMACDLQVSAEYDPFIVYVILTSQSLLTVFFITLLMYLIDILQIFWSISKPCPFFPPLLTSTIFFSFTLQTPEKSKMGFVGSVCLY